MRKLWLPLLLAFLVLPCVAEESAASQDDYEVFTNKGAFLAAVGEIVFQGFESYPTYECSSGGPNPATFLQSDGFTVTTVPADGGTSFLCTGTTAGGSPGPTEGSNALVAGSNTGSTWTLEFVLQGKRPAYAVGFYLTDAAERGDAIFVTDTGDEIFMARCCRDPRFDDPLFFGLVSKKKFRSFQLRNTGVSDGWGIDEVMLGIVGRSE
jgi:hypothetical protein